MVKYCILTWYILKYEIFLIAVFEGSGFPTGTVSTARDRLSPECVLCWNPLCLLHAPTSLWSSSSVKGKSSEVQTKATTLSGQGRLAPSPGGCITLGRNLWALLLSLNVYSTLSDDEGISLMGPNRAPHPGVGWRSQRTALDFETIPGCWPYQEGLMRGVGRPALQHSPGGQTLGLLLPIFRLKPWAISRRL